MMMNLLSIGLVLTSLLVAQVWSPPTPNYHHNQRQSQQGLKKDDDAYGDDHVIVTEGHRVIVVETYDQKKVPISTQRQDSHDQDTKLSGEDVDSVGGVGELICDAFGKCKKTFASAIGKAKESVLKDKERVKGSAHEAKERVEDVYEQAKGTASDRLHEGREKIEDAYEKAKERASQRAHEAKDVIEDAYEKAKERASERAHEAKNVVEDAYEKAKERASQRAHEAKDVIEDAYERAKESATHKAQDVKESAKESLTKAKETGSTIGKEAPKDISEKVREIAGGGKQRAKMRLSEMLNSMASLEAVNSLMGLLHLLGFAIAYGMCVWVTFLSSYVLAGILPRHQFGLVQSKLYPVYFKSMATSIAVALLGYSGVNRDKFHSSRAEMLQGFNLLASGCLVLVNLQFLEPLASKAMFERFKLEKEEGRGRDLSPVESRGEEARQPATDPAATTTPTSTATGVESPRPVTESREAEEIRSKMASTSKRLERLNYYSSMLNLISLMALTWHLVYIGQCLHLSCSVT